MRGRGGPRDGIVLKLNLILIAGLALGSSSLASAQAPSLDARVSLDIVEIEVDWAPPQLSLVPATARPYFVLDGTIDDNEAVSATVLLRGTGCRQRYTLVGVFTSADTFEGTLEGEYGTATCNGCEAITSWRVSGTREAGPGKTEP